MEDITIESSNLIDLQSRANVLASTVDSLAVQFEDAATTLKRRDEVARLNVLRVAIQEKVEWAKLEETSASSSHAQVGAICSMVGLAAGLIGTATDSKIMKSISRALVTDSSGRKPTFGTILVRIGPGGVPEDVEAISVSRLARESTKGELEVMGKLRSDGSLLLTEEVFSLLIERVATAILQGGLSLPMSTERLSHLRERRVILLNQKNTSEPT